MDKTHAHRVPCGCARFPVATAFTAPIAASTAAIVLTLTPAARARLGKSPAPSTGIVDSQSVASGPQKGERGVDAVTGERVQPAVVDAGIDAPERYPLHVIVARSKMAPCAFRMHKG